MTRESLMTLRPAILPLDRAAENHRRTRLLLTLFALIALPSVAYAGQYVAFVFLLWMVPLFGAIGWVAFLALDFLLVLERLRTVGPREVDFGA